MIQMLGGWLEAIIRAAPEASRTLVAVEILLWASAFISAVLDNIPYATTMVPVIEYLAASGLGLELKTLAWALAFGACFGGNATLVGASANIVTATLLERQGHPVTFVSWMRADYNRYSRRGECLLAAVCLLSLAQFVRLDDEDAAQCDS